MIKNKLIISVCCLVMSMVAYADSSHHLKNMLPNDLGKILLYKTTDFNKDGYLDVIVVSESYVEDKKYGYERTLSIFFNHKNQWLYETIRNPYVIACSKCSDFEYAPDPFEDKLLSVSKNTITITQNFDIKFHPSVAVYKFIYKPKIKKFKTISAIHALHEFMENSEWKLHVTDHAKQFGQTLDAFNPEWHNLIGIQDQFYR